MSDCGCHHPPFNKKDEPAMPAGGGMGGMGGMDF